MTAAFFCGGSCDTPRPLERIWPRAERCHPWLGLINGRTSPEAPEAEGVEQQASAVAERCFSVISCREVECSRSQPHYYRIISASSCHVSGALSVILLSGEISDFLGEKRKNSLPNCEGISIQPTQGLHNLQRLMMTG